MRPTAAHPRGGWSFLTAATVVVITGSRPWLPPVGTAAKSLQTVPVPLPAVALDTVLGLRAGWPRLRADDGQTKAPTPVIARPTTSMLISRVPS